MRYDRLEHYLEDLFHWFSSYKEVPADIERRIARIIKRVPKRDQPVDRADSLSNGYEPFIWSVPLSICPGIDQLRAIVNRYNDLPDPDGTLEIASYFVVTGDAKIKDWVDRKQDRLHLCQNVRDLTVTGSQLQLLLSDSRLLDLPELLGRLFQFVPYINVLPRIVCRSNNSNYYFLVKLVEEPNDEGGTNRILVLSFEPIANIDHESTYSIFLTEQRIY